AQAPRLRERRLLSPLLHNGQLRRCNDEYNKPLGGDEIVEKRFVRAETAANLCRASGIMSQHGERARLFLRQADAERLVLGTCTVEPSDKDGISRVDDAAL